MVPEICSTRESMVSGVPLVDAFGDEALVLIRPARLNRIDRTNLTKLQRCELEEAEARRFNEMWAAVREDSDAAIGEKNVQAAHCIWSLLCERFLWWAQQALSNTA